MLKSIFSNHILFFSGLMSIAASNAMAAMSDAEGARLREFRAGQFVSVYTDSRNNLSWSRALPDRYSNGCINEIKGKFDRGWCSFVKSPGGRQVYHSKARDACRDIGARLPTDSEYYSLIRNFDHKYFPGGDSPRLTPAGIAQMQAVFGDMQDWFWTSTVEWSRDYVAASFNNNRTGLVYITERRYPGAVRCVLGR